jgi:CHASE3 domain sensor protein
LKKLESELESYIIKFRELQTSSADKHLAELSSLSWENTRLMESIDDYKLLIQYFITETFKSQTVLSSHAVVQTTNSNNLFEEKG